MTNLAAVLHAGTHLGGSQVALSLTSCEFRLQVSGNAILKALQASLEQAPSALAARTVLEGFDTAVRLAKPQLLATASRFITFCLLMFVLLSQPLGNFETTVNCHALRLLLIGLH